MSAGNFVDFS